MNVVSCRLDRVEQIFESSAAVMVNGHFIAVGQGKAAKPLCQARHAWPWALILVGNENFGTSLQGRRGADRAIKSLPLSAFPSQRAIDMLVAKNQEKQGSDKGKKKDHQAPRNSRG